MKLFKSYITKVHSSDSCPFPSIVDVNGITCIVEVKDLKAESDGTRIPLSYWRICEVNYWCKE